MNKPVHEAIRERVQSLSSAYKLGSGFTLSENLTKIFLYGSVPSVAAAKGRASVSGDLENTRVYLTPDVEYLDLVVDSGNHQGCEIAFIGTHNFTGVVKFEASNCLVVIGQGWFNNLRAHFVGPGGVLFIGDGCSSGGTIYWIEGEQRAIIIGDDCMFAWDTIIRTGDAHGVIDLTTKEKINHPNSVVVGPHVWLSPGVSVQKGTRIGAGSIIGGRSVVTSDIEARCFAAGAPARMVRKGVTWSRSSNPSGDHIRSLIERPYMIDESF